MDTTGDFRHFFDVYDYVVFGSLLVASTTIGIYFACTGKKKQNSAMEYLLGNREIGCWPIAMSLIATHYSGVSFIGYIAEIYVYGSHIWAMLFLDVFMTLIMMYWFVPVFYSLQLTSMYEYLNKRFNSSVRTIGSILFVYKMMVMIPIGVYGPVLVLSQASGISLQIVIPVICFICTFYTTIGGFKAVVWTDTLQMLFMVIGIVVVPALGTYAVGGFKAVIDININGDRLEGFNTSWDPTVRHTLWSVMIGKFFNRLAFFIINQGTIQRCLATPTLKQSQMSLAIFGVIYSVMQHITLYTGLVVYAAFYNCDPVTAKLVQRADQVLPLFVMKTTGHIPALPGIFLSAMFGATLSTMSTGLNSMSGVIVEDFIQPFLKKPMTGTRASVYMKITTILLGAICVGLTFMVENLSGIIQGAGSMSAITIGSLFGIICLGMFFPWANATGAIAGGVCSSALVAWMAFGSQMAIYAKQLVYTKKPVSIDGCSNATLAHYYNILSTLQNATTTMPPAVEPPFVLYAVSYTWYTFIGVVTVLVVGNLVSLIAGPNNARDLDPKLLSPAIKRFLPKRKQIINQKSTELQTPIILSQARPLLQ